MTAAAGGFVPLMARDFFGNVFGAGIEAGENSAIAAL